MLKLLKLIFSGQNNETKGKIGELKVDRKLNPFFFNDIEHKQINDLIICDQNGNTHQIDHIEIRHNGIFCIETKNISGWIFGSKEQTNWTQVLYEHKYKLYNPLKQNETHVRHLNKLIDTKYHINSLIVMAQNNAKRINCDNVINIHDLKRYLNDYNDGTLLCTEEMENIYNTFLNAKADITEQTHVDNVKKIINKSENGFCPLCGGKLVERKSQHGTFLGCSNYPRCTFIKNK